MLARRIGTGALAEPGMGVDAGGTIVYDGVRQVQDLPVARKGVQT